MKPLRDLAKGWGYRIDDHGRLCVLDVSREVACMYYQQAPASCFADAKPEEPLREGNRVVVKDGGSHLRAIRGNDADFAGQHGTIAAVPPGISTIVCVLLDDGTRHAFWRGSLRHERDDERPAGVTISGDEAVAAMNPEPVIGCKLLRADGGSLVGDSGRRLFYPVGKVVEDREGVGAFIAFAGGLESAGGGDSPSLVLAAFECGEETSEVLSTYPNLWAKAHKVWWGDIIESLPSGVRTFRRVRRLPEIPMDKLHPDLRKEVEAWQAKHEPKPEPPPRKFADGQWFRDEHGNVDRINRHEWKTPINAWAVYGETGFWWYEKDLMPCPPPLSEAQRRLQPGDKVSVREKCYDEKGRPEEASLSRKKSYELRAIDNDTPNKVLRATVQSGCDLKKEFLHNLEAAEEK